jgi:hypothetical protein
LSVLYPVNVVELTHIIQITPSIPAVMRLNPFSEQKKSITTCGAEWMSTNSYTKKKQKHIYTKKKTVKYSNNK